MERFQRHNWICKKEEKRERKKKLFPWGSSTGPFFIAAESALNGTAGWKRKASGWRGIERYIFLMGS